MLKQNIFFHIYSDTHLEKESNKAFNETYFKKKVISKYGKNYLILAGDIGDPFSLKYKNFLNHCNKKYDLTYLISGNHENYFAWKYNIDLDTYMKNIIKNYDKIVYLNNDVHKLPHHDDVYVFGTTMWSEIKNPKHFETKINKTFEINKKWLKQKLFEYSDKKVILITHHTLSHKLLKPKYIINCYDNTRWASNLDHMIKSPIFFYVYGHTHDQNIQYFGKDKIMCCTNAYSNVSMKINFNLD